MTQHYLALLARYVRPQGWRVGVLVLTLAGSIAMQLVLPQLTARFIDSAFASLVVSDLLWLAVAYIGAAVVGQGLNVVATYFASYVGWTATNQLRGDLAEHALNLDLSFHKSHTPGELIERVDGDVTTLTRFFSQFFIILASNILLMAGVVVLLSGVHWLAGVGAAGFALLFGVVMLRLRNYAVPFFAEERQRASEFYGLVGEQMAAREDLRANGAVAFMLSRIDRINQYWMLAWQKSRFASTYLWMSTLLMYVGGSVVSLAIGGYLYLQGAATIGTVYLLYNYFLQISQPIERIREELEKLQSADAGIMRLTELLNTRTRLDVGGNSPVPNGAFALRCDAVSFRYEDADAEERPDWILRDLSFDLAAGQTVGILGRTGSGKSTLARLLLRLYDAQQGEIRYSGVSLRDMPLADLRQRVGLVTQDVQIFQGTVRDNITFFNRAIDDARILETITLLGLGNWLNTLPNGLDTELGGDSSTLSAGEAQLLVFTRVFLKNPGLVILDEASSRLDPATERRIERAISRILQGRTGVIIAHRLATVERVDKILILDKGRLMEYGDRAALAADPTSRFAHLRHVGLDEVLA